MLQEATTIQSVGPCPVLGVDVSFCLGFQPSTPQRPFGPDDASFGHFGTGGAVGFADPSAGISVGYVMNHVIPRWQSTRNRALISAVYASLWWTPTSRHATSVGVQQRRSSAGNSPNR